MVTRKTTLDFELHFLGDGELRTTFLFEIKVSGQPVWPVRGESVPLEIQIDDLLAHLTEFWKPLMLRQVYPIAVTPARPSDLRAASDQRWTELQQSAVQKEEQLVSEFEEAHDLSRAFGGVFGLPSFWMMRSTDQMLVECGGRFWMIPFGDARSCLSDLGDELCKLLAVADFDHWNEAIDAWNRRNVADDAGLLAWSASIDKALAKSLIAEHILEAPKNFDDAANDNDELRIAARMAGALPPEQIRSILRIARQFSKNESPALQDLANKCSEHVSERFPHKAPFEQGEALALFVRGILGIQGSIIVDPFRIATDLGIRIRLDTVDSPTFDGLAIWGSRHGPGVFLNTGSDRVDQHIIGRIEDDRALRVTLAHELCHLLIDGGHALSAIEVLNARMPRGVEARAKAFAGELLLPKHSAAGVWQDFGRPSDRSKIEEIVRKLADDFVVTKAVAAWKLEHGAALHNADLNRVLNTIVPYR
jgi:hypothetical protein